MSRARLLLWTGYGFRRGQFELDRQILLAVTFGRRLFHRIAPTTIVTTVAWVVVFDFVVVVAITVAGFVVHHRQRVRWLESPNISARGCLLPPRTSRPQRVQRSDDHAQNTKGHTTAVRPFIVVGAAPTAQHNLVERRLRDDPHFDGFAAVAHVGANVCSLILRMRLDSVDSSATPAARANRRGHSGDCGGVSIHDGTPF